MQDEKLKSHIHAVRKHCLDMVYEAQSGHLGGSLSAVDVLSVCYFEVMDIHKENVKGIDRDRFVLSKGHAAPALYAILYEKGLLTEDLMSFRKIDSKLQGHPNMNCVDGVDMSTGSLGQGISCAVGMALANQLDKNEHRIYAMIGDGECEEGEVWEAVMAAAHYHLHNLCVIVDFNSLQIDGNVRKVMNPTPIDEKFKAFGWNVIVIDGHDLHQIRNAFDEAKKEITKPTMILAHTIKGEGVSFMENKAEWHGKAPTREAYLQALEELEVC